MKKILTNYCFAIVMMATACNPKVATVINNSFEPLAPSEPVKVLQITEEVPTEATLVGNLKVKDSGFSTNCSYETVIESAKMTARNNGCNLLKITRHLTPDIISTCHRIDALMYKMNWKKFPSSHAQGINNEAITNDDGPGQNGPEKDKIYLKDGRILIVNIFNEEEEITYFEMMRDGLNVKTSIENSEIANIDYDYKKVLKNIYGVYNYPKYRIALNYGLGFRMGKVADNIGSNFEKLIRKQMSGGSFSLSGTYFLSEGLGIGTEFSMYAASSTQENISLSLGDVSFIGSITDDLRIIYVGPSMLTRYLLHDGKSCLLAGFSFGYIGYNETYTFENNGMLTMSGSNIGMKLSIGYDLAVADHFGLGVQLVCTAGSLSKMKFDNGVDTITMDLPDEQRESLSNLELSLGLRFF